MRACGRHEAQDAEVERRSLGRDQGGGTGERLRRRWLSWEWAPPVNRERRPDDCASRGRCALYSYERHGRPIPYTGIDGGTLARHPLEEISRVTANRAQHQTADGNGRGWPHRRGITRMQPATTGVIIRRCGGSLAVGLTSELLADAGKPVARFTAVVRECQNSKCTFPR